MLKMPVTSNARQRRRPDQLKRKSRQTQVLFSPACGAPKYNSADRTLGYRAYAKSAAIQCVEIVSNEFA